MSAPFRSYEPDQSLLFPPNLRDWLPTEHLAYFVMDVVATLDLKKIYAYYDIERVTDQAGNGVERAKSNRGCPAYHPQMMTGLLVYGYVTGVCSSRQIEKKCVEDVAFRVISGDRKPDHDTISNFRRVHLEALAELFLQVLKLCQKAGLVKLGHVALDGTKVKANASKHKAMSYGYMGKREEELKQEIAELMKQAEETDREEDEKHGKGKRGDELPKELARRESRLKKIQEAKAALEAEAKEEAERLRREREEAQKARDEQESANKAGRPPKEISDQPADKAQRNFTDPESRIMVNGDKAFIQGYNAQAAVDHDHQIIVAHDVTNQAADAPHLQPMVQQVQANVGAVPQQVSADAGYFSEANVKALEELGTDPYVAAERLKHREKPLAPVGPIPKSATTKERMIRKLRTVGGRAIYALRKLTVEPVFGQTRTRGLVRFWFRGVDKVRSEWALWCMGHNLLKLFRSGHVASALE